MACDEKERENGQTNKTDRKKKLTIRKNGQKEKTYRKRKWLEKENEQK